MFNCSVILASNKKRGNPNLDFRDQTLASLRGFEPPTYRLGELSGSVNPCQRTFKEGTYIRLTTRCSKTILVIWISFLLSPDKSWKLADSLQLLTSGESSVVTDRYHLPATIPLQAGMINNIQLTRFLLLLYTVVVDLSMAIRPRQPIVYILTYPVSGPASFSRISFIS